MTNGFIKKKYNRMYIAMLLSWAVCLIGSLSDSIVGGIFISEDAVSATGLVQPVFSLVLFVANLLGIGCSTKFSNYAGAFDKEGAQKVAGIGVIVAIISGSLLAALMYFGRNLFFSYFAVSGEVEVMARDYYNCFIWFMVITPLYYTFYYLASIDGDDVRILSTDITNAICNAFFSLLLVQKCGIKGLAYGSILGMVISSGIVASHYFSKRNSVKFNFKIDFKIFKEICIAGSTMSLTTLYIAIIDIYMNKFVIEHFGASYLAAYAIVNLILNLGQISICATDASSSFIGVSYGEKNPKAIRNMLNLCTKRTMITTLGMTAIFLLIAKYVPAIYGITTPEIVDASIYITRVLALSYLVTGFVYEWIGYLPMIDKSFIGNIIAFVYMLAAPILFPLIFTNLWGFKGMVWGFFATPFAGFVVGAIFIIAKYGIKAFPYAIDEVDSKIFIHEFAVNEKELTMLREQLRKDMAEAGLASGLANKVELILEETIMIVIEKNNTKKEILGDCTLIVTDDEVNLITRDNGVVFDITKEADDSSSLRHYVAARLMSNSKNSAYLTTISFNRNSYVLER